MRYCRITAAFFALAVLAILVAVPARAQIPHHFSYQGLILQDGVPYTGEARFKFALVDTSSGQFYWSNDGTPGEPVSDVLLQVEQGVFSALLGDPPMERIRPDDIAGFTANQALRVWVDLGEGQVQLGDQPLSSVLFAQKAFYAEYADGTFTANGQIWSKSSGFKFPDNTVQTTAASGGGGAGTLDEAYDGGGSGVGRQIVADSGNIEVSGGGGLKMIGGGAIGVDVVSPLAPVHIGGGQWNPSATYGDLAIGDASARFGIGLTTQGPTAGEVRLRSVGGTNSLLLGGDSYDVLSLDPSGIEVLRGPFRVHGSGRLSLDGNFGTGENNAAINAKNQNPAGVALSAETWSSGSTVIARQWGQGDLFSGYNGNALKARIQRDGHTVVPSVEVTTGNFQVTANGQVSLVGDFGGFEAGTALRAENTHVAGVALWAETAGISPTVIIDQHGTGDMIDGYQAGNPRFRVKNNGQVMTPSIQITGGADLAEPFGVTGTVTDITPGSVMIIDPLHPGRLALSREPYDPRVAGIVSGAGGVQPGLTLSQEGITGSGPNVALTGRVYVRASTENGAIQPGDMLTTSSLPGVAMRATDRERAFGAVVGKAMTALQEGEGLVLVLVGLQ